jgi:NADH-quinone oxidoreductase subunit M
VSQIGFPLLSLITWLPALGALVVAVFGRGPALRALAVGASIVTLAVALVAFALFNRAQPGLQLVDNLAWVPTWGLGYRLGIDGINVWLMLIAAIMFPFAALAVRREGSDGRAFFALLLLLETATLGTFLAQDLILFYVFFEATLVPTALLLGIWGGAERRRAAAKFFLFTFAGSVFMLLGMIALYLLHSQQSGTATFAYDTLAASLQGGPAARLQLNSSTERLLFFAFFIAFAIKIALWPFHTWMPLLHGQTPVDGSVDVGAVLLKVIGGYGMVRFTLGLFPQAAQWAAPAVGVLAVIGIIYGAWVASSQRDIKQVLAYSSVSHLAFVVLGIYALNAQGVSGALLQLVNYALTTGALFLAVGALEQRTGTRQIRDMGGLWLAMPAFGSLVLTMMLASIGLPGLNGFVGEFTLMQGAWLSQTLGWRYVLVAVLGVILAAVYMLRVYRIVFMGSLRAPGQATGELSRAQLLTLGALVLVMVVIGFYPNLVLGPMQPTVEQLALALSAALASQ